MQEIWKDIKDYEGRYQVSNLGRVRSFFYGKKFHEEGRIISTKLNNRNYTQVHLFKNGKEKMNLMHRLVAEAFIPNPNNLPQVNHIDENKENNCANNLEWCNNKYNAYYGTRITRSGEKHRKQVFQYDLENNLIHIYNSLKEAGKTMNLAPTTIGDCCRGKTNTAGGYKWKYKEEL